MATGKYYEGIGRRKAAIARVRLFSGAGDFQVNERPVAQYFPVIRLFNQAMAPLKVTQNEARFNVEARIAQSWVADARPTRQGTQETWVEEGAQGEAVHQTVSAKHARTYATEIKCVKRRLRENSPQSLFVNKITN